MRNIPVKGRRRALVALAGTVLGTVVTTTAGVQPAAALSYTATYAGATRTLTNVPNQTVENLPGSALVGQVTNFQTDDPAQSCLNGSAINLWTNATHYPGLYVAHNGLQGTQCTYGTWTFPRSSATASPSSLSFGSVNVGSSSSPQSVTVTGAGPDAASGLSVAIGGSNAGDFSKGSDTCSGTSLAQNATCSFQVTFTPTAAGTRSATATVTSGNGVSLTVSLSGTGGSGGGGTPAIKVTPTTLKWTQAVGPAGSDPQAVLVESTGTAALTVSGVTLSGSAAGDFEVIDDTCSGETVPAGDSCTFSVVFTPTASGTRSASAVVGSNAGNKTVSLSGLGDVAAPTTTFSTANNGIVLPAPLGTVTGNTSDNVAGVDTVVVTYTPLLPTGSSTVQATLSCNATGRSCSWSAPAPTIPGVYTVNAKATDRVGNEEFPGPSITVIV